MDETSISDVSAHNLLGAALRVHAARVPVGLGRLLPLPVGPDLVLSHPRPPLVHHGLDAAPHCAGDKQTLGTVSAVPS